MSNLARLAVGTIQPEADLQAVLWALLDALEHHGVRTQTFLSRACFRPHDGAVAISGTTSRYLDSWLMEPEVCRQAFLRGTVSADLAIVDGRYDQPCAEGCSSRPRGGSLEVLCDWLDLPRVAVVDVSQLNNCRLPQRPSADRLLLDRLNGCCDFYRWQTLLESLWGIPVIGALRECTEIRNKIGALAAGQKPLREWCAALGQEFLRFSSVERLMQLASCRGIPNDWESAKPASQQLPRGRVQVAMAYDDAFHCYFPDTLDMLELRGATVRVFSPLRDECLPPDTDVVYLGCGSPHEHAQTLADNHCMLMALKEHVCSGRRIYAEGGGLAYLCQHVETADGRRTPMVGALQAVARRNRNRLPPEPVELTLAADSWLGAAGTSVRGYRNGNWLLEPAGCVTRFAGQSDGDYDLIGRHQAIGSRIHLNFAAQPQLLGGFLRPCPAALAWSAMK